MENDKIIGHAEVWNILCRHLLYEIESGGKHATMLSNALDRAQKIMQDTAA